MSHTVAVRNLIKRSFALLLGNVSIGRLIEKLDLYINDNPIRGLHTSFEHLKNGCVSLLTCCEKLVEEREKKNELGKQACSNRDVSKSEISCTGKAQAQFQLTDKEKQLNDSKDYECSSSSQSHARLQQELQLIKESDQYKKAVIYFKKANDSVKGIFKDKDKTQNDLFIKIITICKVLIISDILGDLTNLTDAIETCEQHILKLHESLNAHSDLTVIHEYYESIIYINMKVFDFMREFTGKPVVMLDWPMIHGEKLEKFHPILGRLQEGILNSPDIDPFTYITDASKNKVQINSCIATISCSGDIFARDKVSTDILRITPNCDKWYSFGEDFGKNINIVSIAIDCTDCKTSEYSKVGETSTQSNAVRPCLSRIVCRGKMYILAWGIFEGNIRYILYVISMEGRKEREEELGFLERIRSATEPKVKIFCIHDKKVVLLDVSRRVIHICDNKGMEKHTIDVAVYLNKINAFRPPIFTCNGEIVCLESKLNFFSKIKVYDIAVIGEDSTAKTTKPEINVQHAVQAAAFNHKSDEIIILCYNFLLEYHLMTYSKEDGKLLEDIRLHNHPYRNAGLIFNSHGPIALLDDFKLLRLK